MTTRPRSSPSPATPTGARATRRSAFAGGDPDYLRDVQYVDATRLGARGGLHERYRTAAEPWFDWVAARIRLVAACRVLEVGCGPGWLWERTTAFVPPDVCLVVSDVSPGMVHEAVERVAADGRVAQVEGRVADCQHLPFDGGSFDRVVANHMLYHLPEPAAGVAELARVVHPDGRVVVATNGRRHMFELGELRAEVFGGEHVDETVEVFGAEVAFPVLRDHFGEVRWAQYHDRLRCTDPDDVVAYVRSTPPADSADADALERLDAAVAERFAAAGGTLTITKDVGCFVCTSPRPA